MKKLAIVGTHPATRNDAPFNDPNTDIWVFNESAQTTPEFYPNEPDKQWCTRWDAVIQLHKKEVYSSPTNWVNNRHWEWLQRDHGDKVIWMQEVDHKVPNSRAIPLDDIIKSVPGGSYRWFTSSASYAIALAIYLGYRDIGLYGLDMESNTEYGYQLLNFVFWVGICEGMGINLYHVSNKKYFSEKLYGYEGEIQLKREYFTQRKNDLYNSWQEAERQSNKLRDRTTNLILERRYEKLVDNLLAWRQVAITTGKLSGAEQEAINYETREDMISRQQFERRAAEAAKQGEEQKAMMYVLAGKTEYIFNVWKQSGNFEALQQLRTFIQEQMQMAYNVGASLGAYQENLEYIKEYDDLLQAAGGVRTLSAMTGGTNAA